jgi:putative transposase
VQATSAEAGAGWWTFFRDRTARGLSGVALVTSDAHQGLVSAPRCRARRGSCRVHYATTLMTITPKTSWRCVRTLLHSIYDQPDADSSVAQYDGSSNPLPRSFPKLLLTCRRTAQTCSLHRVPQGDLEMNLVKQPRPVNRPSDG